MVVSGDRVPSAKVSPAPERAHRFLALDSLRGIAALAVAIFHLTSAGVVPPIPFFVNGWLFVDFFFVLSGLVIAATYGDRLAGGFPLKRFMFLRLGRIYPMHFAVLAAIAVKELIDLFHGAADAFSGGRSLPALLGSLGLVHIFGFWDALVWNVPSWSIAAEMWTYLVFALICAFAPRQRLGVMLAVSLAMLAWMTMSGENGLNRNYSGALPRSLYGFGMGVLAFRLIERWGVSHASRWLATGVEAIVMLACIGFITVAAGAWSFAAPPLFLLAVFVFAQQRGLLSRVLTMSFPVFVGKLSYSIYMIQFAVLAPLAPKLMLLDTILVARTRSDCAAGSSVECTALRFAAAFAVPLAYIAVLIISSYFTFRLIEEPARRWSRKTVGRFA